MQSAPGPAVAFDAVGLARDRVVVDATTPAWLRFVVVMFVILIPRLAGLHSLNIYDDAFITFRHADNLATGDGLTFNRGTRVLGTTSPLLAVWLAGARITGLDIPSTARTTAIVSDVVTGLLTYGLLHRTFGPMAGLAGIALFALEPYIVRIAVGGMESSVFLALSVVVMWSLLARRVGLALLIASVAIYVRPEGVLLWLISVVRFGGFVQRRRSAALAAATLTVVLAPLVFMSWYYGSPIPTSVASKAARPGSVKEVLEVFFYPEATVMQAGSGLPQAALTLVAAVGLPIALVRSPFARLLAVWVAIYAAAYTVAKPPMWSWYALPVYFAKTVFAGVAVGSLLDRFGSKLLSPRRTLLASALATALGAVALVGTIGQSPVHKHIYRPLHQWCASHTTGTETIAAGDVGALGYYCNAFIYDLAGLVWPERARYRTHLEIVEAKRPDYILAEVSSYWKPLYDRDSPLRQRYEPLARFSRYGHRHLDVTPAEIAAAWQQDYVLFRRRD